MESCTVLCYSIYLFILFLFGEALTSEDDDGVEVSDLILFGGNLGSG